jgi:hypothetical protein
MSQFYDSEFTEAEEVCIKERFESRCTKCKYSCYVEETPVPGFGIRHSSVFKLCFLDVSDVEIYTRCSAFERDDKCKTDSFSV